MNENIQIIQKAYEHFGTGNIPALLDLLTSDVEWRMPTIQNVPYGGVQRGPEQVGAGFFANLAASEDVLKFEPKEFAAQGDRVFVLGAYSGRVKATGRTYEVEWAHVFTVRDGKIASFVEYTDTAATEAAHLKAQAAS